MQNKTNLRVRYGAAILAAWLGIVSCISGWSAQTGAAPKATTPDQIALDKLMAPIALYPDPLLAQVLACASSPEQLVDFNKWLEGNQTLQGSQRQDAAQQKGFDASFVALSLFPDVVGFMVKNIDWTTELGKAFISDQKAVLESAQRLRALAAAVGNLKTTQQQVVTTENQGGQQTIVIQPANPQVVYVPVYNPQVVYVSAPPPSTGSVVAAGVIGFGLGIALGAAMNNSYYGWGAWGCGWHSHTVVIAGGAWHVPHGGHYAYARPVSGYHPNRNVYAPRNTNVNVNVNNANRTTYNRSARPAAAPQRTAAPRPQTSNRSATNYGSRGYGQAGAAERSGTKSGAFSGYQSGGKERAASARGRSSSRSGGRSRGRR
jgi:hypothetical protein